MTHPSAPGSASRVRGRLARALRKTAVIVASCVAGAALAVAAADDTALESMADAERAFAKAAATRGIRAAFLEYLDDDAVGFQPTLGRAKAASAPSTSTWVSKVAISRPASSLARACSIR